MRILILGGDGYLGWPTAMYLSARGHEVSLADNMLRRRMHLERSTDSLTPIPLLQQRVEAWERASGIRLRTFVGDLCDPAFADEIVRETLPEAIVHYGEQPSAPYSMLDREHAVFSQRNNVEGNLNILWSMKEYAPECHLVKLGTMGEYGTPNIDIEEGYIEIEHNGRRDTLPFPKLPGSFYHLSKVHDSHNIHFACRIWDFRATDLNQGVVYGIETEETKQHPDLATRFDYDELFGTVLNRFCLQAVIGQPLTVYGKGGQTRGFINIRDTLRCVELACENPADAGEMRVYNQFTETFTVAELAKTVQGAMAAYGGSIAIEPLPDPRVEAEEHYYNPRAEKLLELGLEPHMLSDELVKSLFSTIERYRDRVIESAILPRTRWR